MAQGLMLTVAAPGIYVTPECEHINSGLCYLTVSMVLSYFHVMKVMEIVHCEILIKELSCHESPGV